MLSQKKKLLSVVIISAALPLTVYAVLVGLKLLSRASINTVTLNFSQNPINLNTTTATPVNLVLNAGTNQIGFAEVQFTFDTTKVHLANEITTTSLLKSPQFLGQGNTAILKTSMAQANSTGQVTIILGLDPSDSANPPSGVINLANINLIAVGQGSSSVTFIPANIQIVDLSSNALTVNSTSAVATVPGATASPTATAVPTNSPTASPISTATPIPTGTPTAASVNFSLKFQGLNNKGANKTPTITLQQGSTVVSTTNNIIFTSDTSGNYTGTLQGVQPGTYDIYIKSNGYLQKKFPGVALVSGSNNANFVSTPLKVGDFDGNNKINLTDIVLMLSQYTQLSVPVTGANALYDINNDNVISIFDISLALSNYTALVVNGD